MKQMLDQAIEALRKQFNAPSIMLSVHKDGESFFCGGGFADIEENKPVDPDTIYAIASASKAFAATALCILADEGRLDLDDPVKKHIEWFEMYDPYMTAHLTIRDMLSHRSGLPRHDMTWTIAPAAQPRDSAYNMRHLPPAFEPRTRMHYQNHMFALASYLIEVVTGDTWGRFIKERIWDPLGMTRTFAEPADYRTQEDNRAEPYSWENGEHIKLPYSDVSFLGACGSISSTVRDLGKWAQLHANRGVFNNQRIFSEKMADELHMPQMIIKRGEMFPYNFDEVEFMSYGLGWFIESYRGHKMVHHGGTIEGFKSLVGFFPKTGCSFSVLSNLNGDQSPAAIGYIIADMIFSMSRIDWERRFSDFLKEYSESSKSRADNLMAMTENPPPQSHKPEDYVGDYAEPAYGNIEIALESGKLCFLAANGKNKLLPAGYDRFIVEIEGARYPVKFEYGYDGTIIAFSIPLEPMIGKDITFKRSLKKKGS